MENTVYLHSLKELAMNYFCSLLLKGPFGSNKGAYLVILKIFFFIFLGLFISSVSKEIVKNM